MTKEELDRIKKAYYSGLNVQIWFDGYWRNFDARDYSMYPDPFSEHRRYRIVGSDYADIAEKQIAELKEQLETEKKLNEEIKVRFVKCNTCTDEMKSKCLMFSENLCEGDRCEELVDLIDLINKSDLQRENAELKEELKDANEKVVHLACNQNKDLKYKLTEAKEIIKKFTEFVNNEIEYDPEHPQEHTDLYNKLCERAEQFLKEIE